MNSWHVLSSTIIALAVIACVTTLGFHGTLDASAITGILGGVFGIAGGAAAARVANNHNGKQNS